MYMCASDGPWYTHDAQNIADTHGLRNETQKVSICDLKIEFCGLCRSPHRRAISLIKRVS